jgi:hypothetical protein
MKNIFKKSAFLLTTILTFSKAQPQSNHEFIDTCLKILSEGKFDSIKVVVGYPFGGDPIYKSYYLPSILKDPNLREQYFRLREKESYALIEFTQTLTEKSIQKGIYFPITIRTPKDSAIIRYQTIWERANGKTENQASQLTNNCKENLPLGYYFMWSERNGKPTSNMGRRVYVDGVKTIDISEYY